MHPGAAARNEHAGLATDAKGPLMIQLLLLILGVFAVIRLPRLLKIRATEYPNVEPSTFRAWRSAELASAIWLIIATWGVFILQFVAGLVVGFTFALAGKTRAQVDDALPAVTFGSIALLLLLLTVSGIYGSKAKKLKNAAGITWPKTD